MFEDRDLKVLLGNSIKEPEVDYDDAEVASELGYPVEEEALKEYYDVIIVDKIGKPDFRQNYLCVINHIRQRQLKDQQLLAESIMNQIKEVYDFIPSINYDTDSYEEISGVYEFIEFIEYNHEDFIVGIWSFLKPETNSLQIEKYCEQNEEKIMSEIEEQLDSRYFSWMITDFLRTYNKNDFMNWFCEKSENLKVLILLSTIKEQTNG